MKYSIMAMTYIIVFIFGGIIGRELAPIQDRIDIAIKNHIFGGSLIRDAEMELQDKIGSLETRLKERDCLAVITTTQCVKDNNILTIAEQLKARMIFKNGRLVE